MKVYIKTDGELITNILYVEPITPSEWIEVSDFQEPEPREGMYAEMYYRNGKVEYEYKPIPSQAE